MMTRGKFKCSHCSRSFVMAAHLARHESAMHGINRPSARATGGLSQGRRARLGRPVGRPALGDGAFDLVRQMQGYHANLLARRQGLDDEISAIARAMEAMGERSPLAPSLGRGPGRPAGSGGRSGSLGTHIVKVLKARSTPMTPREIAQAVVKSGYSTKSQNLTKAVSNALPKLNTVKRVGFGKYRA